MSTEPVDLPDARLEAIAEGSARPDLSAPGEAALAAWAAAARGPATDDELTGRDEALAAFTAAHVSGTSRAVRPLVRVGVATAALTLLFGGTAAAAYTGALPAPAQQLAHTLIGAPAAADDPEQVADADEPGARADTSPAADSPSTGRPAPSATPKPLPTPSAGTAGKSAAGLCRAWTASRASMNPNSAVVRSLTALAGTAGQIPAYCTTVVKAAPPVARPGHGKSGDKPGVHATAKPKHPAPHRKKPGQAKKATGGKHKQHPPKKPHPHQTPGPAVNNGHGAPPHGPHGPRPHD